MRLVAHALVYQAIVLSCLCNVASGDDSLAPERRYDAGPLSIVEFTGSVKPGSNAQANTGTRVMYQYRYSVRQVGRKFVAVMTSIDLYTVFLPEESWWVPDSEPELLDHEQGHFDVAEISVRKSQLALATAKAEGKTITITSDSRKDSIKSIMAKIDEIRRLIDLQISEDNLEYDRVTRHGTHASAQREKRRIQRLTLDRLAEDLEALNSTSTPTRRTR
ncbi:MAG: hypothetical protein KDA45_05315 [Planctomycetales bacterium]|nr:hypothetical protein [Planctomycetales bacterium]